jgi:RNA polymerase sigma-70 factor, ECF subfamily
MPALGADFPPNGHSDADSTASLLLSAAKRMEAAAWQELLDRYSWLVFQWCRNAGLHGEDAADVVQRVMCDVSVSLAEFQKDGKRAAFRRWLRTITNRRIADFHRADVKQPRGEGGSSAQRRILEIPDSGRSTSETPEITSLRQRLWSLLESLENVVDESTWQAFWLTTIENRTSLEAGNLLQMTPNAIRLAKARVLRRLRDNAAFLQTDTSTVDREFRRNPRQSDAH